MANSYKDLAEKKKAEEEDKAKEAFRPVVQKRIEAAKNEPYTCEVCGGEFTRAEPCQVDAEEIRLLRVTRYEEIRVKMDSDFDNADNPKKDPYGLWDIAKRLQSVTHSRRVI